MNILMTTVNFYPHIGGIETVSEYLADEFTRMGHSVTIVTRTPAHTGGGKEFPYTILRNPSRSELWKAYKQCDVFVHQAISLYWVWPLLLRPKPWFIVYHQASFERGRKGKLKRFCSYFAHNITVSQCVKDGCQLKKATVILNSYNDKTFKNTNSGERRDIAFVGKLTKTKGVHQLIEAFNLFKERTKSTYRLTIIGSTYAKTEGEEMKNLAKASKYGDEIDFVGFKYGEEIAEILNRHKIHVVPSTDREAFGVVALEGLACGCLSVGSDGNGISEAIGKCGMLFSRGDVNDLCEKLIATDNLSEAEVSARRVETEQWLEYLSLKNVAGRYIEEFRKFCKRK